MKETYTCFVMDLYVIQSRWVCCRMLLLLMANFNVGFLMHLSLVIPHVIQSHIWKKVGEGSSGGWTGCNSSTMHSNQETVKETSAANVRL